MHKSKGPPKLAAPRKKRSDQPRFRWRGRIRPRRFEGIPVRAFPRTLPTPEAATRKSITSPRVICRAFGAASETTAGAAAQVTARGRGGGKVANSGLTRLANFASTVASETRRHSPLKTRKTFLVWTTIPNSPSYAFRPMRNRCIL